jgi:hypothetical protein
MSGVDEKLAARLVQLCGMFGSHHMGEQANAAALADRLVRRSGLTWEELIARPLPDWRAMALHVRAHRHMLNPREADFIDNIATLRRPPTEKQRAWLAGIYEREITARRRSERATP